MTDMKRFTGSAIDRSGGWHMVSRAGVPIAIAVLAMTGAIACSRQRSRSARLDKRDSHVVSQERHRQSFHSRGSVLSAHSAWSILSWASAFSVLSAASFLSVGSFASALSVGSSQSVLSVGSSCSVLSVGSSRSFLGIGPPRHRRR
jgi:hypothetical protein